MPISVTYASASTAPAWTTSAKYSAEARDIRWDVLGMTLDSTNREPVVFVPWVFQPSANNATRTPVTIDQDNNVIAFAIDSEQTTTVVADISAAALTTGTGLDISDLDALSTGYGVNVVSNSANTSTGYLVHVKNDHASATARVGLWVENDSTGDEVIVQNNEAGAVGAKIKLIHDSASPANDDVVGRLLVVGDNDLGTAVTIGQIDCVMSTVASTTGQSQWNFYTINSGAQNEAFRILAAGTIQVDLASEVAGTTGIADVFDAYDDVAVVSKWNADPVSRQEFLDQCVDMGIAERKETGSGYFWNLQSLHKLQFGAIGQLGRKLNELNLTVYDEVGQLKSALRTAEARLSSLEASA